MLEGFYPFSAPHTALFAAQRPLSAWSNQAASFPAASVFILYPTLELYSYSWIFDRINILKLTFKLFLLVHKK